MVEQLRNGTSTNSQKLLEQDTTTNHGTFNQLVELPTCKSGAPTQDGSRYSNFKENSLSIQPITRYLMSKALRMRKDKRFKLQIETTKRVVQPTKDGRSFMLIRLMLLEPRASTKNSDSTSTDHSTSDPECQCKELLSATVPTMSGSRDGERTLLLSNGTSMRFQRHSRTTTGSPTHLTFRATVDQPTSDVPLPTQDGGKCSDTKIHS